ncbi:MAG TPA: DUF4255 domain-containing protein [Kineosporiaceae bacterium]|nr:DUF4255 domain-containing protein [Kineosporiaceae bacterium]
MLNLLDESLDAFLREAVPLPAREVDISFEAPDRDWGTRISRPTVNVFLWDVRRNLAEQDAGMEIRRGPGGRLVRQEPWPRIDCRYLVTAWTSEVRDEHSLLGAVLRACLRHPVLPQQHLPAGVREVEPLPTLQVGMPDGKDTADFWSAIGGQLKPALDLVLTATVDISRDWPAGPPVEDLVLQAGQVGGEPGPDRLLWTRTGPGAPPSPEPPSPASRGAGS